jgi:hypothetical protein
VTCKPVACRHYSPKRVLLDLDLDPDLTMKSTPSSSQVGSTLFMIAAPFGKTSANSRLLNSKLRQPTRRPKRLQPKQTCARSKGCIRSKT